MIRATKTDSDSQNRFNTELQKIRTLKPDLSGAVPIVQAGDPVLRMAALPVDLELISSPEIQELIPMMIQTMYQAPGVGLAAPQVGISLQVIVLEDRTELLKKLPEADIRERERFVFPLKVIINPKLTAFPQTEADQPGFFEGCLSVEGYKASVRRFSEVTVEGFNEKGEPISWKVRGWPARILQHEMDHLNGVLYVDRMDSRTLTAVPLI